MFLIVSPARNRNPSAFGSELDGVGQQVGQDLLDLGLVLDDVQRLIGANHFEVNVLFIGQRLHQIALSAHDLFDRELGGRTCILPLSILARSRMSLIISSSTRPELPILLTYFFCLRRANRARQHVRKPDDAIQRRAQFVAHAGQKVALDAVHFVQLHVGLGQLVHFAVQVRIASRS